MEEEYTTPENLIGRFASDDERRVWVATYKRSQKERMSVEMSVSIADRAVLKYRERS